VLSLQPQFSPAFLGQRTAPCPHPTEVGHSIWLWKCSAFGF
jgi:hypothetical protein